MTEKLIKLLNEQVSKEFSSALMYLDLSNWADNAGYFGAKSWFYKQYIEELEHSNRFNKFVLNFTTPSISVNKSQNDIPFTLKSAFNLALTQEQALSASIRAIYSEVISNPVNISCSAFIQEFMDEQIEEETKVKDLVTRIKIARTNDGLLTIDSELLKR